MMIGPISRIVARWVTGGLVAYGYFGEGDAFAIEPDLALIIGFAIGGATEAAYVAAKRLGWST